MSDQVLTAQDVARAAPRVTRRSIASRRAAEWRFQMYGILAISFGIACVVVLFAVIVAKGWTAFEQSVIRLDVTFDAKVIDPTSKHVQDDIMGADYASLATAALHQRLGISDDDADATKLADDILSSGSDVQLRNIVLADPSVVGTTRSVSLLASGNVDALLKGTISRATPEEDRQIKDKQIAWVDQLVKGNYLTQVFNWGQFTYGASSQPETAGLGVALIGSLYMMLIVILLAVPIGVAAAIYLEEFAPRSRVTDLIEVNINNLAAVPSIVFGLLGLAIFINLVGLPRSASLVGGLVLTLMTLPTVIIAARAAITAVPPSIRQAALGIGASKMQSIFHHVLPLAMPGILTGTIIGLAKALGETAPLLMIGMVAFVVDYPKTPLDPATALPVQIYMWSTAQERGFVERTSGAAIVLLLFLLCMNLIAVILRRRFERKW
jgi:phosphate transport system permease protein